jgi:hypothetical protein
MIDIERDVFNFISKPVKKVFPDLYLTDVYVRQPSRFPAATVIEMENTTYDASLDSASVEHHNTLVYEVNVYSNKIKGKKNECKAIIALIDELMVRLGFSRTMLQPIPNMDDSTIYRMTARYRAVVSQDKVIYRR